MGNKHYAGLTGVITALLAFSLMLTAGGGHLRLAHAHHAVGEGTGPTLLRVSPA